MSASPEQISLVIKWSGKEFPIEDINLTSTVADLKSLISEKTNVLPERQKLLNLRFKGNFC
jgi:ubiquitin-like domain-containing CTD phosphatase 1